MKNVSSKLLSYEEDVVEYDNYDEYKSDLDDRRKSGWTREKKPNFQSGNLETVTKHNNGKIIQRYKRFGAINIA